MLFRSRRSSLSRTAADAGPSTPSSTRKLGPMSPARSKGEDSTRDSIVLNEENRFEICNDAVEDLVRDAATSAAWVRVQGGASSVGGQLWVQPCEVDGVARDTVDERDVWRRARPKDPQSVRIRIQFPLFAGDIKSSEQGAPVRIEPALVAKLFSDIAGPLRAEWDSGFREDRLRILYDVPLSSKTRIYGLSAQGAHGGRRSSLLRRRSVSLEAGIQCTRWEGFLLSAVRQIAGHSSMSDERKESQGSTAYDRDADSCTTPDEEHEQSQARDQAPSPSYDALLQCLSIGEKSNARHKGLSEPNGATYAVLFRELDEVWAASVEEALDSARNKFHIATSGLVVRPSGVAAEGARSTLDCRMVLHIRLRNRRPSQKRFRKAFAALVGRAMQMVADLRATCSSSQVRWDTAAKLEAANRAWESVVVCGNDRETWDWQAQTSATMGCFYTPFRQVHYLSDEDSLSEYASDDELSDFEGDDNVLTLAY